MRRDTILILDFGSQYTQLIARRIRELRVFSLIAPCSISLNKIMKIRPKGIIISGGPASVNDPGAPSLYPKILKIKVPILGICYGMQVIIKTLGGVVKEAKEREYGKTLMYIDNHNDLFFSLPPKIISWMSHSDRVDRLPPNFVGLSHTQNTKWAAVGNASSKIYGVQFHPEVVHTQFGTQIISNFLFRICGCFANWQLQDFVEEEVRKIKRKVKRSKVICGVSGGIDSTTLAVLVHRAIGRNLKCIFVDNGLLRKNERKDVVNLLSKKLKMDLITVDGKKYFLDRLKGVTDPEFKRKIIGHEFIRIFEKEASKIKGVKYLAQGTLYPDVIESVSAFGGPTSKIKSHHNVGGLPQRMKLYLIEPFRELFKDEVREIAKILNLPDEIIFRQPFPGPGLAVRIIGEITPSRLRILREADAIVSRIIKREGWHKKLWQFFPILLPLKSVGVMGDKRTYEYVIALRLVKSRDGMTADWAKLPYPIIEEIASNLISKVRGINRVVLDISSKPPATIEWE